MVTKTKQNGARINTGVLNTKELICLSSSVTCYVCISKQLYEDYGIISLGTSCLLYREKIML